MIDMDFEAAARCYNELKELRQRAGGAVHELQSLVAASRVLHENDKVSLQKTLDEVIPCFGSFNEDALIRAHGLLMKHEDFVRAWTIDCLSGNGQRPNF